jgi:hypothetical protein
LGRLGVEVKIKQKDEGQDKTKEQPEEQPLQMVMRHGRVQFERPEKKVKKEEK